MKLRSLWTSISTLDLKKLNKKIARAGRVVTLDVTSTSIRLMETEGQRVTKWASQPLEPGIFDGEVIADPRAFGEVVKQFAESSHINTKNITASISGLYSLNRIIMVPTPAGTTATRQAILDAISNVMPVSEEDSYLFWHPVAAADNGQQVLAMGIPRDMIDSQVRGLRSAAINPHVLDLKTIALIRAVDKKLAIILNIEESSFDIVIVADGIAEVMHTAVWQPVNLSTEEKAEHLSIALELAIGFYNTHHPGSPLEPATPLFITGQMSGDSDLLKELQSRVGYTIEPFKPPLEYPEHLPVSQYAVNIGLALKGMVPSNNPGPGYLLPDINLLPQLYRPWKPSSKQIATALGIIAAIALLFPTYNATTRTADKTVTAKARYAAVKNELQRRQLELAKRTPLQAAIDEYKSIINMGGGFTEDIQVIRTEAEKLGVRLSSITHEGNRITVGSEAGDYVTFRKYITALEASGRFTSITRPPEQYSYVKSGTITLVAKSGK